jgi:branched-chain amino acid transport system ATP-binding protein
VLDLKGLSKHFGGVIATRDVTLNVARGEVHALIGPNGAGKTTLIGQVAGTLRSDSGQVRFEGADITALAPHQRVRRGLARSFQVTSIFGRLSVLENLALAVQARSGSSFSFWRPVAAEHMLFDEARSLLKDIDLQDREDSIASTLAHGEQRALEVGLALATQPKLVLLDEPMAGLGAEESRRMVELIERVSERVSVLLVEHDMDAVFRLADRISVLVDGRIVASGAPQAIRANEEVRKAYLGDDVGGAVAA